MAIKFKDSNGEDGKKTAKDEAAKPVKAAEQKPDAEPADYGDLPGLPFAKSEPKKRGRKKLFK